MKNFVRMAAVCFAAAGLFAGCNDDETLATAETVVLDKPAITLEVGDREQLKATVTPDDGQTLVWSSSDTSVATVTEGAVTAVAVGSARITVRTGSAEAACSVTVVPAKPVEVESVTLDRTTLDLTVGDTERLTATVLPEDAADKTVVWSSSDSSVASVADGLVTALAPGTATVTTKAGGKSAECVVTVGPVEVLSVTLDQTTLDLTVGDTEQLTATVLPEDATDKTVVWSSSDQEVATVADGLVTALAPGTATVTASAGDRSAECVVTVAPAGKSWAVGDLYDEDGVKGVVFWVADDARSGKIVSLDESVRLWATGPYEARAFDEDNGADNTDKIKDLGLPLSTFPACAWCVDHGAGWYMPAINEVQGFLLAKALIDPALTANGGTAVSGSNWYWSSTEGEDSEGSSAICGYITSSGVGSYGEWKDQPEDDTYVRAVYAF